jgi:hypothetical protein
VENCIEFDFGQHILKGSLVYKIQRKHTNVAKSSHDESKYIQLLITWHVEHTKDSHVRALLVEHNSELDEDKLKRLYQKYWHLLNTRVDPIKTIGC